jgi:hypothetical protein
VPVTRYFNEQVLRKRPYLTLEMCEAVSLPIEPGERILRVVTLADGATIHNAFPDRNFVEDQQ